jgi:serine/threonine protein kinase
MYPGYRRSQEILDDMGPVGEPEDTLQLPETQARFIFGCLVSALQVVHAKGYTHHDIKAANFVRFYDGKFKLIDFDNMKIALTVRGPAGDLACGQRGGCLLICCSCRRAEPTPRPRLKLQHCMCTALIPL